MEGSKRGLLLLLVFVTALWVLGVAFLVSAWVVGIAFLIPGLVLLALCGGNARLRNNGSVAAWAACTLAPLGCLVILAVANVHLHEFTGGGAGCDSMAQDCSPQVAQGIAHLVSLGAFIAAGILTLCLIAVSQPSCPPEPAISP